MNKRGFSKPIAVVLIILLVLAAIMIILALLMTTVEESSEQVWLQQQCFSIAVEVDYCKYKSFQGWNISRSLVEQISGEPKDLAVVFKFKDGSTNVSYLEPSELFERSAVNKFFEGKPMGSLMTTPVIFNEGRTKSFVCPVVSEKECILDTSSRSFCDFFTLYDTIEAFNLAISGAGAYDAAYPDCPREHADFYCDGNFNSYDIDSYLYALMNWPFCTAWDICDMDNERGGVNCLVDGSWCDENCVSPRG